MKEEKKAKKRTFPKDFKREACRLVLDEGQKISETARDLGIGQGLLGQWVKLERFERNHPGARAEAKRVKDLEAEVRKLKMERDILKKAMAYFVPDSK